MEFFFDSDPPHGDDAPFDELLPFGLAGFDDEASSVEEDGDDGSDGPVDEARDAATAAAYDEEIGEAFAQSLSAVD